MFNVVKVLKKEIDRLAAKQAKAQIAQSRKIATECRKEVARLKKLLREKEREIAKLTKNQQTPIEDDPLAGVRFSAKSVLAQRRRLGLSAKDYGRLVGVSALSIYAWEQNRARPRKAQFARLVAVRGISKREALRRLAKLTKKRR